MVCNNKQFPFQSDGCQHLIIQLDEIEAILFWALNSFTPLLLVTLCRPLSHVILLILSPYHSLITLLATETGTL